LLLDNLDQPYFHVFYQTKDRLTYQEINTKTVQLFENLLLKIKKPAVENNTVFEI
jgi:ribonuclease P protein component